MTLYQMEKALASPGNGYNDIYWADTGFIEDLKPEELKIEIGNVIFMGEPRCFDSAINTGHYDYYSTMARNGNLSPGTSKEEEDLR